MGFKQNFDSSKFADGQQKKVEKAVDTTLDYFKTRILARAKTVHAYKNQTHRLTFTTDAEHIKNENSLLIFAPAQSPTTGEFYANSVSQFYSDKYGRDENNLKNAALFYEEDIANFFLKEVTK